MANANTTVKTNAISMRPSEKVVVKKRQIPFFLKKVTVISRKPKDSNADNNATGVLISHKKGLNNVATILAKKNETGFEAFILKYESP